jgi:hypothetical protein
VVVALAGCGSDNESSEPTITTPQLTVPGGGDAQDSPTIETAPQPEPELSPDGDPGGAPAPAPQAPPDSPEHDTPPPPDSPAERFEEFCDANPGACG